MTLRHVTDNVLLRKAQAVWISKDAAPPPSKVARKDDDDPEPPARGLFGEASAPALLTRESCPNTVLVSLDPGSAQVFATLSMVTGDQMLNHHAELAYDTQRFTAGWFYSEAHLDWAQRVGKEAEGALTWDDLKALDTHAAKVAGVRQRASELDNNVTQKDVEVFKSLLRSKSHSHTNSTLQQALALLVHKAVALYAKVRGAEDAGLEHVRLLFVVGDAKFNTTRGGRRFPWGKFVAFVQRFFPVIKADEYLSSQTCAKGHFMGKAKKTELLRQRHSNAYFIRCKECKLAGKCHPNGHDKDRTATFNFVRRILGIALHGKVPRSLQRK
jgi:hypothetical protein